MRSKANSVSRQTLPRPTISEWFGHRVAPTVGGGRAARAVQTKGECPFLTRVLGQPSAYTKSVHSRGVCTISAASNGRAQDWVVCPYRVIDGPILATVAERLFRWEPDPFKLVPASALADPKTQQAVRTRLRRGARTGVYFIARLGGEISLPGSPDSPEFSLDGTIVELTGASEPGLGRYAVVEVQTMDFHGSYRHAVKDLTDALRLHGGGFDEELARHPEWASHGIEGPNLANVFKRTIYQTLCKLRLAGQPECAGSVLALPLAVWESWAPHLARPATELLPDGTAALTAAHGSTSGANHKGWLFVFDIEPRGGPHPDPVVIQTHLRIDVETLAQLAFGAAPDAAMRQIGGDRGFKEIVRRRLATFWPAAFP